MTFDKLNSAAVVEIVEMLTEEYARLAVLPLTPQTGLRRAEILRELAILKKSSSTRKGATRCSG